MQFHLFTVDSDAGFSSLQLRREMVPFFHIFTVESEPGFHLFTVELEVVLVGYRNHQSSTFQTQLVVIIRY